MPRRKTAETSAPPFCGVPACGFAPPGGRQFGGLNLKLLLVDGNSVFYRAFFGVRPLSTKDGFPTGALYGFLNILMKETDAFAPDGVAVAFDLPTPTFRHELYDGYKAGRKPAPEELHMQMPVMKEILTAMGYHVVTCERYEADDILGTLSARCVPGEDRCVILTGDRDSLQLVNDCVTVRLASPKAGVSATEFDRAKIKQEYGVDDALRIVDIKALMGDSSDNIPGVAKIGPKTAVTLISAAGDLDKVYENLDGLPVSDTVKRNLLAGKDSAFFSRTLAAIDRNAPIDTDLAHYRNAPADEDRLRVLLTKYELNSILKRLKLAAKTQQEPAPQAGAVPAAAPQQAEVWTQDTLPPLSSPVGVWCRFEEDMPAQLELADEKHLYQVEGDCAAVLKALLAEEKLEKHVFHAKGFYRFAIKNGLPAKNMGVDGELAGYLLAADSSTYTLDALCVRYLGATPEETGRAALVRHLGLTLGPRLAAQGLEQLYREVELPLSEVLAFMELCGVAVDKKGIEAFGSMLSDRIENLRGEIYSLAGGEFNINSPKQLGEVLFEKLGLPVRKKTKSGYSTNVEVLESLREHHPIVEKILEYRTFHKLKSTYVEGFLKLIGPDGRIHSTFQQTVARTGRISSTEPNLQNIPVRTPLGSEMRRFFVAAPGRVLVDADYSQIELRVLAHMSADESMCRSFLDGEDIHMKTASEIFHMPPLMVTPLMRSRAKTVNFGIIYGMGAFSLSKDIGVSVSEAKQYIEGYFASYPKVKQFLDGTVEDARRTGHTTTLFGRIRPMPELQSTNKVTKALGERIAMNSPIQGTAADIIKIAMVRVYRRLAAENMKARLILQVHDELIVEAPEDEKDKAQLIVAEEMQNAAKLRVPLVVDTGVGNSWYDAK